MPKSKSKKDERSPEEKVRKAGYSDAHPGSYEHGVLSAPSPYADAPHSKLAKAAREGEGGTVVRQKLAASEDTQRVPALQRPTEEKGTVLASALHKLRDLTNEELQALADLNAQVALGDTLPGERSLDNDHPGFNLSVDHQHGTPTVERAAEQNSAPLEVQSGVVEVGTETDRYLATQEVLS